MVDDLHQGCTTMPYIAAKQSLSAAFLDEPIFLFDDITLYNDAKHVDPSVQMAHLKHVDSAPMPIEADSTPHNIVFIISDKESIALTMLAPILRDMNVLHLPAYAFTNTENSTRYMLSMCGQLNIKQCISHNKDIVSHLSNHQGLFQLRSKKSDIVFTLGHEIKLMQSASESVICNGGDLALSAFTEVALIPNTIVGSNKIDTNLLGYDVNGVFECDGCLVATHIPTHETVRSSKADLVSTMATLRENSEFPLQVAIQNSNFKSVKTASGQEIIGTFASHMSKHLETNVLELALGTNENANVHNIDWSFNSPINESALGFHLGMGDGLNCPHVDFICCDSYAFNHFLPQV